MAFTLFPNSFNNCILNDTSHTEEKKNFIDGLWLAGVVVALMWIVKLAEVNFDYDFSSFGIRPGKSSGLKGIFLSVFLHKDFLHLFNNSLPLFVAIVSLKYFYTRNSLKILILLWLLSGFITWLIGSEGIHIGASGWVYACLSFLFFGSLFSRNNNFLAFSLVLVFLYGAMIWGIIPLRQEAFISWESHLGGAVVGFILAVIFRNSGPKPIVYDWENEEDNIDEMTDDEIDQFIDLKIKQQRRRGLLKFFKK